MGSEVVSAIACDVVFTADSDGVPASGSIGVESAGSGVPASPSGAAFCGGVSSELHALVGDTGAVVSVKLCTESFDVSLE